MKHLTMILAGLVPTLALAGGSSVKLTTDDGGIITPSVATTAWVTTNVSWTATGAMVVCPTYREGVKVPFGDYTRCRTEKDENAWVYPENVAPPGKTYVGFKIIDRHTYAFFWK